MTDTPDLSVELGFLRLKNPILAASGTFGYGLEFTPFIDLNELGGFVVKGLYFEPRSGNPPPRLVETAAGLINAIGLQGIGVKHFTETILPQLKDLQTAVLVNICGESEEEYVRVADYLNGHEGIAAYELNISCPNVREGGRCPAQNAESTYSLVRRVKQMSARPILTKLTPNVTDITLIARSAEEAGSDAVCLVNTFLAMAIDIHTRRPKLANIYGGLSGPAIKPIALRMVHQTAAVLSIPVIGMGGIMSAADVVEFLLAGASAVQVGTANFIQPDILPQIVEDLRRFLVKNNIKQITDLVGGIKSP
ncbi:MAG: dihydroorotate dehydrogenase [Acidobacteria bacterium]|nr:dihydroorotate dehydrogenase [Acidobacteriota bacterium]